MAACPYCGEALADGAARCTRCGAALAADAGEDADLLLSPDEVAEEAPGATAPKKKQEFIDCPHCGEPVPAKAHRCKHCARPIRDLVSDEERAAHAGFRRRVQLGIAGAVALVLAIVVIGALASGGGGGGRREFVQVANKELVGMFGPLSKIPAEKQKESWTARFDGRYVKWEGRVVEVSGGGLFSSGQLLLRTGDGPAATDVRVTMPRGEAGKDGVAKGASVAYTGRLVSVGSDGVVELDDGAVLSAKK